VRRASGRRPCARSCARCMSKVRHVEETKVGGSRFCLSENRHGAGLWERRCGPDKREVGSSTLPRPIPLESGCLALRYTATRGFPC
jgi:hypothetical protein